MSQNDKPNLPTDEPNVLAEEILTEDEDANEADSREELPPQEEESTVGTGTSMALGCVAGTVVLILFGLLFLALRTLI